MPGIPQLVLGFQCCACRRDYRFAPTDVNPRGLVLGPEGLMTRPQRKERKEERDGERAEGPLFRWEESASVYL